MLRDLHTTLSRLRNGSESRIDRNMDKIDVLDEELRVIDRRIRLKGKKYGRAGTFEESIVQAAQRHMLVHSDEYPMADTLFMTECKRRMACKKFRPVAICDVCNLRFRCWTEK